MPQDCPKGRNGCRKASSYAIYPLRVGAFPFLEKAGTGQGADYHCENDLEPRHAPKPSDSLQKCRLGLKVIRGAYVYLYFEADAQWQYYYADDRGLFTRCDPGVAFRPATSAVACEAEQHYQNNTFISIPYATPVQAVWLFYAVAWLDKPARARLLASKDELMTKIDLSALRAGSLPRNLLPVATANDLDKVFEHQDAADGPARSCIPVFDEEHLSLAGTPSFAASSAFFSGTSLGGDTGRRRSQMSTMIATNMNACVMEGSKKASTPVMVGLFDSIGVSEELGYATGIAAAREAVWVNANQWELSSIARIETFMSPLAVEDVDRIKNVPVKPGHIQKSVKLGEDYYVPPVYDELPDLVKSLELSLTNDWLPRAVALKKAHQEIKDLIEVCQQNHARWIMLKAPGGQTLEQLTWDVYKSDDTEKVPPDLLGHLVDSLNNLQCKRYDAAELDKFFHGEGSHTAWVQKILRRSSATSKEFTRDVVKDLWFARIDGYTKRITQMLVQDVADNQPRRDVLRSRLVKLDSFKGALDKVASALVVFDIATGLYAMYQNPQKTAEDKANFLSGACLTALNFRSLYVLYPQVDFDINLTDVVYTRKVAEAGESRVFTSSIKEWSAHSSRLQLIGSGLLVAGNFFGMVASISAADKAFENGDKERAWGQAALITLYVVEIVKSLGARGLFGPAMQKTASKSPYATAGLIVAFLLVGIWNMTRTPRLPAASDKFFRRSFYGNHDENAWFPRYERMEEEEYGFAKSKFAIGVDSSYGGTFEFTFPGFGAFSEVHVFPDYVFPNLSGKSQTIGYAREVPPDLSLDDMARESEATNQRREARVAPSFNRPGNSSTTYYTRSLKSDHKITLYCTPLAFHLRKQSYAETLGMFRGAGFTVLYKPDARSHPHLVTEVFVQVYQGKTKTGQELFGDAAYISDEDAVLSLNRGKDLRPLITAEKSFNYWYDQLDPAR